MFKNIKRYLSIVGILGLISAVKGKIRKKCILVQISKPGIKFPLILRTPSSDVLVFHQVFVNQEYNFVVKRPPKVILDAGANIGLASIYFSNKFPNTKIFAIEPEESNLAILKKNVSQYENIIPVRGALWDKNEKINLVDPGVGKWGFITQQKDNAEKKYGKNVHEVQGMTVDNIMKEHGIEYIDILKIDIEGAEREVFKDPSSWIEKVGAIIIELHENTKPGCISSFYRGTKGFDNEWKQGELIYLKRSDSCLLQG